jgi:peptide/nickel transport system ATP-binding protein
MTVDVELRGLAVWHGSRALVSPLDLQLGAGESITILGESGSGKSLLAHAIMGTIAANLKAEGRLRCDGREYDLADPSNRRAMWGRVMAILPQEPAIALDPTMRTLPQVAEGLRVTALAAKADELARERLGRLGLVGKEHHFPHTLSGGMAQRVAFAAATISGARFLIADEPTKGLDSIARDDMAGLLQAHVAQGGLLLTITHDIALARQLGGRVLIMRDSEIVEQGAAEQVLSHPQHAYTRELLAADPAAWDDIHHASPGELLISARGLGKSFPPLTLFSDLHVDLHAGERVALLAPSGTGKTTLGNVLLGLLPPDAGSIRYAPHLRHGSMQKLYQDPVTAFAPKLTLRRAFDDLCRRHRLDAGLIRPFLERLRLPSSLLDRLPSQVSGGELQRLALIRALLLKPRVVFADEPTSRLDPVTQRDTFSCLLEELKAVGCALLLVTHDEALAAKTSHRTVRLGHALGAA